MEFYNRHLHNIKSKDDPYYACFKIMNGAELKEFINNAMHADGLYYDANLNFIDVSGIQDFSRVFCGDNDEHYASYFHGDISLWDVSHAYNMIKLFYYSEFTEDVSQWQIPKDCNVKDMFDEDTYIPDEYLP